MRSQHFKKKLEEEKEHLEAQLARIGRQNSVPDDWEPAPAEREFETDVIDQADVVTNRLNEVAVLDALEARYDTVLTALRRIEEGTFGTCEVCGETVAEERLEANPAAATCTAHM